VCALRAHSYWNPLQLNLGVGQQRVDLSFHTVFDISFLGTEPELQEEEWYGLAGRVSLGDYRESFVSPLEVWSRDQYEAQWREAALRLVNGEERSAFFTSAFQSWWAMWRRDDVIYVHEELLVPQHFATFGPAPDLTRAPYQLLGPYASVNEDGEAISEWQLSIDDIRDYLRRRSNS
jgi:contact-dependent growth inhibition (CDI) system CdiI-like immunity protein